MFTSGVQTVHRLQLLHHLRELQQVGGGVLVPGEVAGGRGLGEAGGVAAQHRGVAGVSQGEGVAGGVAAGAEPAALQLGQAGQVVGGLATSKTHWDQQHIQHGGNSVLFKF